MGVGYFLAHWHKGPQVQGVGQSHSGPQGQIGVLLMVFLLGWRWPVNAADVRRAKTLQLPIAGRSLL